VTRAAVTGATGFVGANLARRLLADGHQVHLLVRQGGDRWRLAEIADQVICHAVDIGDAAAVDASFAEIQPTWVFNLAAHGAYSWQTDVHEMIRTNIVGTINLVDAAQRAGVEAFVQTGSSSEYGKKDHPPAEDEHLEPNSAYAVTKAAATHYCRLVGRSQGLPVTVLRLYSVFGPWEDPHRLLPALAIKGLSGTLPPLVNPTVGRDFIYVDDVVDACLLAAAKPPGSGTVLNVGTGVQTTLSDVVAIARAHFDIADEPCWGTMPDRGWDTDVWVADPTATRRSLGWAPTSDVATGFRALVDWLVADASRRALYEQSP